MSQSKHEFKVLNQENIPNDENPEKVKITVEGQINNEKKTVTKTFTPKQVRQGRWEKHFCIWIEEQENKKVPNLEGETIENSGYDFTGPERDYNEK